MKASRESSSLQRPAAAAAVRWRSLAVSIAICAVTRARSAPNKPTVDSKDALFCTPCKEGKPASSEASSGFCAIGPMADLFCGFVRSKKSSSLSSFFVSYKAVRFLLGLEAASPTFFSPSDSNKLSVCWPSSSSTFSIFSSRRAACSKFTPPPRSRSTTSNSVSISPPDFADTARDSMRAFSRSKFVNFFCFCSNLVSNCSCFSVKFRCRTFSPSSLPSGPMRR
mmetsp:Transcript_81147/g.225819  ORF Transcript_81147/g.225819 Transcript_81147/m.225819 type:complete len:224 (+) Transcript_81147:1002-1673(+)